MYRDRYNRGLATTSGDVDEGRRAFVRTCFREVASDEFYGSDLVWPELQLAYVVPR
jgi:hypothetical protein